MNFAHEQGARIMLSEFAPVPGTPDGEQCREWSDLDEPLLHNKTAFTIRRLGAERVQRLKAYCRELNSRIARTPFTAQKKAMSELSKEIGEHHESDRIRWFAG